MKIEGKPPQSFLARLAYFVVGVIITSSGALMAYSGDNVWMSPTQRMVFVALFLFLGIWLIGAAIARRKTR